MYPHKNFRWGTWSASTVEAANIAWEKRQRFNRDILHSSAILS